MYKLRSMVVIEFIKSERSSRQKRISNVKQSIYNDADCTGQW